MSSENIPAAEETAPEVQSDEHMESAEECVVKEIGIEIKNDNNIGGGDELDYEENDTNDASAASISNGDNDEQKKQENVSNGDNDDQEMQENAENMSNGESCDLKKDDGVEQEAVEEAEIADEDTNSITKDKEQDEESTQMKGEEGSDGKSQPTQQVESEESEVINCKDFGVTALVGEKQDENVITEMAADKSDGNAVSGKGDEAIEDKKEATDAKERKPSGIETDPTLVCKPCNLVFESDKWCSRHKESGDHLHVVKGGVPGRGRYHCFLCWMSFQHSEGLVHHIGRSDHLKRAKRKGVKSIWMKPGASGAAGISTGDLRAQITGRGDLRDHLTDKRDQPERRDHHEDKKSRDDSRALHRDRDRRAHHHRSRSPVRIYLDQFYEVSSVGDCDMGNCKSLRKIVSSSKEKSNKEEKRSSSSKEKEKKDNNTNNSIKDEDKIDVKDGFEEVSEEKKEEANQDSGDRKSNGIVETKEDGVNEDEMETDDREQNHEVAEGKDSNDEQNAKEADQKDMSKSDEIMDVNDAQNNKEGDVNHQSGSDERFETNEESNKNEISFEDATDAPDATDKSDMAVSEDTEMETEDKKDTSVNGIDQNDDQVNNKSCPPENETSEKNDVVENSEDITEQLQPE